MCRGKVVCIHGMPNQHSLIDVASAIHREQVVNLSLLAILGWVVGPTYHETVYDYQDKSSNMVGAA